MMTEDNWDLQAVVRGYVGLKTPPHFSSSSSSSSSSYSNPTSLQGIHDHREPFFAPSLHQQKQTHLLHFPTHSKNRLRKNQQKMVCHVPAIGRCDDMWAWRKYGQKPIKGSPFPRGYYRCSTSKTCIGRKQVERSQTDPTTFIITYTGEHNHPPPPHRSSLAGSTLHHKLPSIFTNTVTTDHLPVVHQPLTATIEVVQFPVHDTVTFHE